MKRINENTIKVHANRDYGGDVMALYKHMAHEPYQFDEKLENSTQTFRTDRKHNIITMNEFKINVDFTKA
jgi:hypothetical protein